MPTSPAAIASYLDMERREYAALVARSQFGDEAFAASNSGEHVVGSYAGHEAFDYERWLLGGLTRQPGAVAIDYGCGPGRMLKRMARFFQRVDGVDISPEVIAVAQRRTTDLPVRPRLWVTDGASLPVDTAGQYDFAFSVICLQHICVHTVRYQILDGLYRALKPGGVLSFQLGYGPGHPNMVDYEHDFVQATATNGGTDVGVVHPGEIAADLTRIGFTRLAYALTPTGPGDRHGAWIFVRAVKPGSVAAIGDADLAYWTPYGFTALTVDPAAVSTARHIQRTHGVVGRRRNLHRKLQDAERTLTSLRADLARAISSNAPANSQD